MTTGSNTAAWSVVDASKFDSVVTLLVSLLEVPLVQ